jgi:uncharacterized protein (TIRG00374 family)
MDNHAKSVLPKNLFTIITLALSVTILLYFLFTTDGIVELGHIVKRIQIEWLLWIVAAILGGWLLEGYVLHLLCKHLYPQWEFGRSFTVAMVGLLYSALTPFSAGEPMEVYTMNKMGMDTGAAGSIIAVKSLIHHGVTLFYSLLLVALKLHYFQTSVTNFSFLVLLGLLSNGAFIALVIMFIISEKTTDRILTSVIGLLHKFHLCKHPEKTYQKVHDQLSVFHGSSKIIGKSFWLYIVAIVLTVVQITLASIISYFVYRSFGLRGESVVTMIAADTFVMMVAAFIPLPGSSGGAEGGFALFFGRTFGSAIIPAILLWRIATYYVNILFGCIIVYFGNKRYPRIDLPGSDDTNKN